jgi:hypothetical protein
MAINFKRIAYKIEFQPPVVDDPTKARACLYPPLLQDAWVKAVKNDFAPDGAFRYHQLLEDFKSIFHDSIQELHSVLRHITEFSMYYQDEPDGIAQFVYQKMPQFAGNPAIKLLGSDACHRFIGLYMYKRMHIGLFLRLLTDAANINALTLARMKSQNLLSIVRKSKHANHIRQAIKFWAHEGNFSAEKCANIVVSQEFGLPLGTEAIELISRNSFRKSLLTTGTPVFVNQFSRA